MAFEVPDVISISAATLQGMKDSFEKTGIAGLGTETNGIVFVAHKDDSSMVDGFRSFVYGEGAREAEVYLTKLTQVLAPFITGRQDIDIVEGSLTFKPGRREQ